MENVKKADLTKKIVCIKGTDLVFDSMELAIKFAQVKGWIGDPEDCSNFSLKPKDIKEIYHPKGSITNIMEVDGKSVEFESRVLVNEENIEFISLSHSNW